jgi:hypothetical protein
LVTAQREFGDCRKRPVEWWFLFWCYFVQFVCMNLVVSVGFISLEYLLCAKWILCFSISNLFFDLKFCLNLFNGDFVRIFVV